MLIFENIKKEIFLISRDLSDCEIIFENFHQEIKVFPILFDKIFDCFKRNLIVCSSLMKIKGFKDIIVGEDVNNIILKNFGFNKKDIGDIRKMYLIANRKKKAEFEFVKGNKYFIMDGKGVVKIDFQRLKQFILLNRQLLKSTNFYLNTK